ncbi:hypothetical protein CR513_13692, partial [Mucuna pruriens]
MTFGIELDAKMIPVMYMVIKAGKSHNVTLRRPMLNIFRVVVLTPHLYMKYPVGDPYYPWDLPSVLEKKKVGRREEEGSKETNKLLVACFIREVWYPTWLANMVMVKKSNGKWRVCTNYTDLNKAFPKDPYPLPSIDQLVDEALGYGLLSFMDAYSRYNQI